MSKEEITIADFVNLSNDCVGAGIIPTGKKMFELAQLLAKQEAIAFAEWLLEVNANGVNNDQFQKIVLIDGDYYWETDKEGDQSISPEQLYSLYLQNKK